MIKVLIISYHSLPLDLIASYRANAYFKHFRKYGIEPTLLTHYMGMVEQNEVEVTSNEYGTLIRTPPKASFISRIVFFLEKLPFLNKVSIFLRWSMGYLDASAKDLKSYHALRDYSFRLLQDQKFDLVLGIFSPHHHLRLCYELHQKFNVPYVLDFRDLWHNRIIQHQYKPNYIEIIQDHLSRFYWKKWLSKASFFTITSEAWRNKINEFSNTKGYIITNGFDAEVFNHSDENKSNEFTVIHAGSLYEHQQLPIFLDGCAAFLESKKPQNFKVKFIGADRKGGIHGTKNGFMFEPKKRILDVLPGEYCEVTKRIPKSELIGMLQSSQVLLFPGLPDSPGTHLGKIFDYIASGVNILLTPDDHDVVGELIRETGTGKIANTPEEVCEQLSAWYEEWQQTRRVKWHGNLKAIKRYSRESQVKNFAEVLQSYL